MKFNLWTRHNKEFATIKKPARWLLAMKAWWPGFGPWSPHKGERGGPTPQNQPLTSTSALLCHDTPMSHLPPPSNKQNEINNTNVGLSNFSKCGFCFCFSEVENLFFSFRESLYSIQLLVGWPELPLSYALRPLLSRIKGIWARASQFRNSYFDNETVTVGLLGG